MCRTLSSARTARHAMASAVSVGREVIVVNVVIVVIVVVSAASAAMTAARVTKTALIKVTHSPPERKWQAQRRLQQRQFPRRLKARPHRVPTSTARPTTQRSDPMHLHSQSNWLKASRAPSRPRAKNAAKAAAPATAMAVTAGNAATVVSAMTARRAKTRVPQPKQATPSQAHRPALLPMAWA